jgi:anti-anti-sigma factor
LPGFRVETEQTELELVVRLIGEFDFSSYEEVDELLMEAQNDRRDVRLDLRELTFIDSSGLRVLLRANDRAGDTGGRLRLVPGSEAVERILALTGVGDRFEFVERGPAED